MKSVLRWCMAAVMALSLVSAASAASADDQRSEERIKREVRHELVLMPQLTIFDNLSFTVDGGTVTLLGQVRNAVLKDEASAVIKRIEVVPLLPGRSPQYSHHREERERDPGRRG